MELKDKHIAVALNEEGKCILLAKNKVVSEREYNRLVNEYNEQLKKEKDNNEKNKLLIKEICDRLYKIENKDFLLAKSIYDNFVDRGLINDNDDFQKEFYNFIFNDLSKAKLLENAPSDFQIILRKVGNL